MELGPGRATLMKDLLNTLTKLKLIPSDMNVHLVEISTGLKELQKEILGKEVTKPEFGSVPINWHEDLSTLPTQGKKLYLESLIHEGPLIFIAHEFFDALPVFQFEVLLFSTKLLYNALVY